MLMALDQFVFDITTLSYNELSRSRNWKFANNSVAFGRDTKQFLGSGDDKVSIQGNIYQEHNIGKIMSIDYLATMADSGQGFTLVDGSGYFYGIYIIESIDETKKYISDMGVARKIDFTLNLERVDDGQNV